MVPGPGSSVAVVFVKICGITCAEDALLATALETFDSRLATLQGTADEVSSALDKARTATGHIPNGVAELIDPEITLQNAELRAIDIRQRLGATALTIANVDGYALAGLVRAGSESISFSGSGSDRSSS